MSPVVKVTLEQKPKEGLGTWLWQRAFEAAGAEVKEFRQVVWPKRGLAKAEAVQRTWGYPELDGSHWRTRSVGVCGLTEACGDPLAAV